jgi:3-phosphoshikimate 1-carboxyvinyltransferase
MATGETWVVKRPGALSGSVVVPGDKSISHRAALIGAVCDGDVTVDGFLFAEDTRASLGLVRALGASVTADEDSGRLTIHGVGVEGLGEPADTVDCANSGTTMRLGAGLAAGVDGLTVLTGDASLRLRPMGRIVRPLEAMGARIDCRGGDGLAPLAILGGPLRGIDHFLEVASAQVKSAVLLAGLRAAGVTRVTEPGPTRDHTERLLRHLGADVRREGSIISIAGGQRLSPRRLAVVGDFSSAAFLLAAAAVTPDGEVSVARVGLNATRTGFLDVLEAFGAKVEVTDEHDVSGEPCGTVRVIGGDLRAARISGELVVRAIDELPLVGVLGSLAKGRTVVEDAAELRVKETDRIAVICERMAAMGARIEATPDGFVVDGPNALEGAEVDSAGDHRVAMAMAVAGLAAEGQTTIRGADAAEVSFPGFVDVLSSIAPGAIQAEAP